MLFKRPRLLHVTRDYAHITRRRTSRVVATMSDAPETDPYAPLKFGGFREYIENKQLKLKDQAKDLYAPSTFTTKCAISSNIYRWYWQDSPLEPSRLPKNQRFFRAFPYTSMDIQTRRMQNWGRRLCREAETFSIFVSRLWSAQFFFFYSYSFLLNVVNFQTFFHSAQDKGNSHSGYKLDQCQNERIPVRYSLFHHYSKNVIVTTYNW